MKKVSFKVAKAIKEAGYPDTFITDENENQIYVLFSDEPYNYLTYQSASIQGYLNEWYLTRLNIEWYFAPTYLEVWLWLWREKKINVTPEYDQISGLFSSCGFSEREDPEEAIEAAIEFLVNNSNLIR